MFTHHTMRILLSVAAFGLSVAAVALPRLSGGEGINATSSSSQHQYAQPTTPSSLDYGPDVKYARPWPTSETTTTTPYATVSSVTGPETTTTPTTEQAFSTPTTEQAFPTPVPKCH
ncbi:hypothetical protein P171DRAFT_449616 [Karstenula rhodostoma CBS 690.94]|uniref:Uncharacterized protein n=1 Tax=Karstenula rhodostoma CBS 690.94 TaxID=1392251 RepID=A0A9P4P605_9PLEO|nr:hypothetical protein P171DRAFT_449616 [Karstenula rhodostoma CBS 690.94]